MKNKTLLLGFIPFKTCCYVFFDQLIACEWTLIWA